MRHAHRQRRFSMRARHGLDSGPESLGEVSARLKGKRDPAGREEGVRPAENLRPDVVHPHQSYSAEKGPPWVHDRRGLEVVGVSDEHAKLHLSAETTPLRLGDKLRLIPGHCDPTVNLHDWYVGVRAGYVEALWQITARSASR